MSEGILLFNFGYLSRSLNICMLIWIIFNINILSNLKSCFKFQVNSMSFLFLFANSCMFIMNTNWLEVQNKVYTYYVNILKTNYTWLCQHKLVTLFFKSIGILPFIMCIACFMYSHQCLLLLLQSVNLKNSLAQPKLHQQR